ncbi:hypothetical protein BDM02DRAFT_3113626 [Thelephora ganbajun]|uniref:Uncharacterized protein n=1 Tax=Thelephora ganbajun TaxID=370292 RepID=A0ACB6ZIT3_THEGA|nr:hypothetical protein BDM02DRAFT_3113626 [Thelephora ganbajun]
MRKVSLYFFTLDLVRYQDDSCRAEKIVIKADIGFSAKINPPVESAVPSISFTLGGTLSAISLVVVPILEHAGRIAKKKKTPHVRRPTPICTSTIPTGVLG